MSQTLSSFRSNFEVTLGRCTVLKQWQTVRVLMITRQPIGSTDKLVNNLMWRMPNSQRNWTAFALFGFGECHRCYPFGWGGLHDSETNKMFIFFVDILYSNMGLLILENGKVWQNQKKVLNHAKKLFFEKKWCSRAMNVNW